MWVELKLQRVSQVFAFCKMLFNPEIPVEFLEINLRKEISLCLIYDQVNGKYLFDKGVCLITITYRELPLNKQGYTGRSNI